MPPSPFDSLVRECRPQLVRYLCRLVGDDDAEDVVQIVLSKASVGLAAFRGEASPRSWLFKIATNAAHDWNRSRARVPPPAVENDEAAELGEAGEAEDESQERRLVREEMSQCVGEVLRRLPEGYQAVLALSDCEELSDREIAAALDITVGAAKIRLHRARARLKEELERECYFYRDQTNVLCCDRKAKSTDPAYRSESGDRLQVGSRTSGPLNEPNHLNEEHSMSKAETLPTKQKHLLGVGAAIAAGCQPCTQHFVAKAREAGACERGVRIAIESGLTARACATAAMTRFANETFAVPELDAASRAEKAQLSALIEIAAAIATNSASLLPSCVEAARALNATNDQIRLAAEMGRVAKGGAERETERALGVVLGDQGGSTQPSDVGCCSERGEGAAGANAAPDKSSAPPRCGCQDPSTDSGHKTGNGCC